MVTQRDGVSDAGEVGCSTVRKGMLGGLGRDSEAFRETERAEGRER